MNFQTLFFRLTSQLTLRHRIYLGLVLILIPVFGLVNLIQGRLIKPLLEEEVKSLALSTLRSLSTDIRSNRLLTRKEALEDQLIELTWSQPSIIRIEVWALPTPATTPVGPPESIALKLIASNIADTPAPVQPMDEDSDEETVASTEGPEVMYLPALETPEMFLRDDPGPARWEIKYPLRDKLKDKNEVIVGLIRLEISLRIVRDVSILFQRIYLIGTLVTGILLILLLSFYLSRLFESERKLHELSQELALLQSELHHREKLALAGQLTASIAHEIGTPLHSLYGHVQLLETEIGRIESVSSAKNRIGIIASQIERIEKTVQDFLSLTARPQEEPIATFVGDVVQNILQLVSTRTKELGVEIQLQIEPHLPSVFLYPNDLEQILLNLLNNALDELEEMYPKSSAGYGVSAPKTISISVKSSKAQAIILTVQDTGRGISTEDLRKVFKPFFTKKSKGKGTGLGLAICQQLAQRFGGQIQVQSELGKGTAFQVSIPYERS